MTKTMPSLNTIIKGNPKVSRKQMTEIEELGKRLMDIPPGSQRVPSPIVRRHIVLGDNGHTDHRTIRITTHR